MKFPPFLYMSPQGPKWQPKYLRTPGPRPPTDRNPRHREIRGVQFAPRGLVINVSNNLATRIYKEIHCALMRARAVLGAAVVGGTLFAGSVTAREFMLTEVEALCPVQTTAK